MSRPTWVQVRRVGDPPEMRLCRYCNISKPLTDFYEVTNGVSVTKYFRQGCKECWNNRTKSRQSSLPPSRMYAYQKKAFTKIRVEVLGHYSPNGIPTCACCGTTYLIFLTLDHINDDGNIHRRSIGKFVGNGIGMYRWAKRNNFPPIFQPLCWNCNWAKRLGVTCPHKLV